MQTLIKNPTILNGNREIWSVAPGLTLEFFNIPETGENRYAVTIASQTIGKDYTWLSKIYSAADRESMRKRWRKVGEDLVERGLIKEGFSGERVLVDEIVPEGETRRGHALSPMKTISEADFFIILVAEARRNNQKAKELLKHIQWEE